MGEGLHIAFPAAAPLANAGHADTPGTAVGAAASHSGAATPALFKTGAFRPLCHPSGREVGE